MSDHLSSDLQTSFNKATKQIEVLECTVESIKKELSRHRSEAEDLERERAELEQKIETLKSAKAHWEQLIAGDEDMIRVLDDCRNAGCEVRDNLAAYMSHVTERIVKSVLDRNEYHVLLSYYEKYAEECEEQVIKSHREIIENHGFCWWGKFFERLDPSKGEYEPVGSYGESIRFKSDGDKSLRKSLEDQLNARCASADPVYLFLCDPNPGRPRLHVCEVDSVHIAPASRPNDSVTGRPVCGYVPRYLFHKDEEGRLRRRTDCDSCKHLTADQCVMKYRCNFWFKLTRIEDIAETGVTDDSGQKLTDMPAVQHLLSILRDSVTGEALNFAVPILYPLFVHTEEPVRFFGHEVEPQPVDYEGVPPISDRERGHTKVEAVEKFLRELHTACPYFSKAISHRNRKTYKGRHGWEHSRASVTGLSSNELQLTLPAVFRGNQDQPLVFRLILRPGIPRVEADTVLRRIENHLADSRQ